MTLGIEYRIFGGFNSFVGYARSVLNSLFGTRFLTFQNHCDVNGIFLYFGGQFKLFYSEL